VKTQKNIYENYCIINSPLQSISVTGTGCSKFLITKILTNLKVCKTNCFLNMLNCFYVECRCLKQACVVTGFFIVTRMLFDTANYRRQMTHSLQRLNPTLSGAPIPCPTNSSLVGAGKFNSPCSYQQHPVTSIFVRKALIARETQTHIHRQIRKMSASVRPSRRRTDIQ
jgi:hypothetical protein